MGLDLARPVGATPLTCLPSRVSIFNLARIKAMEAMGTESDSTYNTTPCRRKGSGTHRLVLRCMPYGIATATIAIELAARMIW